MKQVTFNDLKQLYIPPRNSHKGQNGRILIIGGSHLFHAASLWALQLASRIVDLVHYSSVPENNELVLRLKSEFRNGIVVHRTDLDSYINEDDCILIGPGMVRSEIPNSKIQIPNKFQIQNLKELNEIEDEGWQTEALTNYLLRKYPHKQWVIDAGALQMMDINLIPKNAILTPHHKEFEQLWEKASSVKHLASKEIDKLEDRVQLFAKHFQCIVLVKGEIDIACDGRQGALTPDVKNASTLGVENNCCIIEGGNSGMTKGGTGDVLAGLIAALACKNDPFLATTAGSFINKYAGDSLFKTVGPYFNASDLADEIPKVMKRILT